MKRVVVFTILAMVLIVSCAAQSAAADAQRIVGTWTVIESRAPSGNFTNGTIWVFNANGSGTIGGSNFSFGISADGYLRIGDHSWNLYCAPNGSRFILRLAGGVAIFQRN